jgi:predicted flap endonuclease-1-like 5' DNA nuclease
LTASACRAILRQTEQEKRDVPEFTTNQWAILFLVLVLGWLLGLVSRSGGRKWKRAYQAERDARADEQAELEAARARVAELEAARPAPVAARVEEPVAVAPVTTTETLDLTRDDLSLIRGIGAAGQRRLNEEGIYRYSDITGLTPAEEAELEKRLGADDGYIEQEQWREQAALLESGQIDQHRATFG